MVTALATANNAAQSPVATPATGAVPEMPHGTPAALPPIPLAPGTGVDPQDFARARRIHIQQSKKDWQFVDPYLVIHPGDLAPENQDAWYAKLRLTLSITNPSFFEAPERSDIALNLGQLVPLSLGAKRTQLMQQVQDFNKQVDNKADADLVAQATDKRKPFSAIVRDTTESPTPDPVGVETLKNGLAMYLLMREKLTQNHYYGRLSDYVTRMSNPEQVLGDLADNIGVSGQQVREAALSGGIDGVGRLLGLDPAYVADVKKLTDYAATQDFGYNLVEHWHLGRQLLGINAPIEQKIAAGLEARIEAKTKEYRAAAHHNYTLPPAVQDMEKRVASMMNMAEPIQRKLMYALGYEICYTPEMTADQMAFHRGIYGLHRKAANDLRDIRGTYRIYFSGKGDPEGSAETLVHEMAHNLWPEQFAPAQASAIDQLAASDQQRFAALNSLFQNPEKFDQFSKLFAAYKAGNAAEKAAVIATANELFAAQHITVDALFPKMSDPFKLKNMVALANDTLQVEGDRYNKSGYESPQERFREVISRYAAMKQVRLRGEPEMMEFIAPGLTKIWNQYYIPHLETVYQNVLKTGVMPTEPAGHAAYNATVGKEAEATAPAASNDAAPVVKPAVPEQPHPQPSGQPESAAPSTVVHTSSLQMNARVLAAKTALDQMGVHASF